MLLTPDNTTTELVDSPATLTILILETFLLLWIIIANFLLWVVLRITAAFHIPLNYILASLILANYLFAASSLPFELINVGLLFNWRFGKGLCEVWHGCDVISRTAFPWFLLMLSIERWVFCKHRTWYNSRKKTDAIIGIVCTWIFVLLVAGIGFVVTGLPNFNDSGDYNTCYWSDRDWTYALYHALLSFFVPTFLALLLYLVLVCWLGGRSAKVVAPSRPATAATTHAASRGPTSVWSDMSLPATPPDTRPTSTRPTSTNTTRQIGLELSPVVTNRVAPLDPVAEPIEAWGGSVPPEGYRWDELLFSKMLLQKTIRAPTAKPVLNEDLIKTLPPARNPRLLPKLDRQPAKLPPLQMGPNQNNPFAKNSPPLDNPTSQKHPFESPLTAREPAKPVSKESVLDKSPTASPTHLSRTRQKTASQASMGGGGIDSGFGSNSALSDKKQGTRETSAVVPTGGRRGSKWSVVSAPVPDESEDSMSVETEITPSLKLNSIKWLWVLFVVYVLCWCPFYVVYLLLAGTSSPSLSWEVYAACRFIGAVNSALNPLILMLVVRQYREALGYLLRFRDPNSLYAHMQADWDDEDDEGDEGDDEEIQEIADDKKSATASRYTFDPKADKDENPDNDSETKT